MGEIRTQAPVIKRKKVVNEAGHHGGAWKVAYADFVTAMMAFFMLMWLMNATTEKQRKGLADYFSPTIPVNRISGGGDGMFGGTSVFSEDVKPRDGTGNRGKDQTGTSPADQQRQKAAAAARQTAEAKRLQDLKKALEATSGDSDRADPLHQHIRSRVTDEGLVVEMFDLPGAPLFADESSQPTLLLLRLTAMIADVFRVTPNAIAIAGFVRSVPAGDRKISQWDLSMQRADELRRRLVSGGTVERRIERVTGWADRKPADADPTAVRNNRVEIILLRSDRAAAENP